MRYFTLLAVRDTAHAAAARSGRPNAPAATPNAVAQPEPTAAAKDRQAGAKSQRPTAAAAPGASAAMPGAASAVEVPLPVEDVARNLYDMLAALPERCAGAVGTSKDATESGELTSWVGLEQVREWEGCVG